MSTESLRAADPEDQPPTPARQPAETFTALYRREFPRLVRYLTHKLGNREDANDLAQEAMVRYVNVERREDIRSPAKLLTRIATNLWHDHTDRWSTHLAEAALPVEEALDQTDDADPHRDLEGKSELGRWKEVLNALPPQTLDVFLLNRLDGLSYTQIADQLGVPLWRVQKHMLKAIRHIARHRDAEHD